MWTTFLNTFVLALMVGGFTLLLISRRRFVVRAVLALMIALVSATPELVFGYFPRLHKGWISYVVVIAVVLVIVWPFSFWIERLNRKEKRDA